VEVKVRVDVGVEVRVTVKVKVGVKVWVMVLVGGGVMVAWPGQIALIFPKPHWVLGYPS
jgi:hypothetical protein